MPRRPSCRTIVLARAATGERSAAAVSVATMAAPAVIGEVPIGRDVDAPQFQSHQLPVMRT